MFIMYKKGEKKFIFYLMRDSKGQVTIFIIVAVVMVAIVALFFLLRGNVIPAIGGKAEENPGNFLEVCMEDSVHEALELISSQGGYVSNPLNKTFQFEGEKDFTDISYLCYNQGDYLPCVNQEPMLIQHLKNEIKDYIFDDVNDCFDDLTSSFKNQGYGVEVTERGFDIGFEEGKVVVDIDADVTLTKSGETTTQNDFQAIFSSKFYDLAIVVQEIVNKEATTCEFNNYDRFSYTDLDIYSYRTTDSSVIYKIKHLGSEEEFKFAIRGCVMPAGFGIGA